jgi:hypothetical protein
MFVKSMFFLFMIFLSSIFLVSYFLTGTLELQKLVELATKYGYLQIAGKNPIVEEIYINTSLTTWNRCTLTEGDCPFECNADGNRTYVINATIYDENGDCDSASFNVKAYLCQGTGTCNSATKIYEVPLNFSVKFGLRCNYTGNLTGMEYYRRWGSWRINVTAIDPQNLPNNTVRYAYYNPRPSLTYPYPAGDAIVLGTIQNFDVWSNGLGGNTTKNVGNIRLNVTYNATDFTCTNPVASIPINGQNFAVGNDTTRTNYALINDNPLVPVEFFPPEGMRRCGNYACSVDEDGAPNWANYTLYWHINVSSGTPYCQAGPYTNSIGVSHSSYTAAG